MNITECCAREKVSEGCIDACSFFSDIETVLDKPQCLPDFDKLMKCSAGMGRTLNSDRECPFQ